MKKRLSLTLILITILIPASGTFGQVRRKPITTAPVSKPKVVTPTETKTSSVEDKPTASSPAQEFFNHGVKCDPNDYDCQISNYTKAINLNLNTKDVFKNRGSAYLAKGEFDKAVEDFTKVIELDKNDAGAYKTRGTAYYAMPDGKGFNSAINDFTSAIDLEPQGVEAFILRAKAYFFIGETAKGYADFDRAIQLDPKNTEILIYRAKLYENSEDFDKAIEIYSKVIALQPKNTEALLGRAKSLEMQKKDDLAVKDYSAAIELDSKNPIPHLSLAEMLEKNKKFDEAINEYSKAVEIDSTNQEALLKRAKLYRQIKNNSAASDDITKVIELSPRDAKAYEFRCGLEKESNILTKAVEDCSIAISLDPNLDDAYIYRYDIIMPKVLKLPIKTSDLSDYPQIKPIYDQANKDIGTGIQNTRTHVGMKIRKGELTAENFLKIASAQSRAGIYFPAEENYSSAIELDPSLSAAYAGRGKSRIFRAIGSGGLNSSLAIAGMQDYQKAISLDSSNISLLRESVQLLYDFKELDQLQLEILEKAVAENPNNSEILYMRAERREAAFRHEYYDKVSGGNDVQNKVKRKLQAENWNGIPAGIESDLKRVIELYDSSKKGKVDRQLMADAVLKLAEWSAYYNDIIKPNKTAAMEVFNKAIEKWADVPELYINRGGLWEQGDFGNDRKQMWNDYDKATEIETRLGLNIKEDTDKIQESIIALNNSMKTGIAIAKGLPNPGTNEIIAESNTDKLIREQELQKISSEDADRNKKWEEQAEIGRQELIKDQQELAEMQQKQKADKARRNAETVNALLGLINTAVQVTSNKRQSTPQAPQTITQTTTTTRTSGGQTSSANVGQTNGNSTNSGNNQAEHAHIYDINEDTNLNDKCMRGTADTLEHCWGNWQSLVPQIQTRVRGPVAFKGNLVNQDTSKTVYYEWSIQSKNPTNNLVCVHYEVTNGDGRKGTLISCMVPGGTQEFSASEYLRTLYPTGTINVKAYDFETCINVKKTGAGSYHCDQWDDEKP